MHRTTTDNNNVTHMSNSAASIYF